MASLRTAKASLRTLLRSRAGAVSAADKLAQGEALAQHLGDHGLLRKDDSVALFLSTPREVNTLPCVRWLLEGHASRVFLPAVLGPEHSEMSMLQIRDCAELEELPKGAFGIRAPQASQGRTDSLEVGVDVVLVPVVGFNAECERLGAGGGYFDSFMVRQREANAALGLAAPRYVGLALRQQETDYIPREEHDQVLDAVVTADGVFRPPQ